MSNMNAKAAVDIIRAIYETVTASKDGVPAGVLYAQLMTAGCTLRQYEQIEGMLIRSGMVTKKGDVLHATTPPMAVRS